LSHITQYVAFALFYSVGGDKKLRNAFGKIKAYTYINIIVIIIIIIIITFIVV